MSYKFPLNKPIFYLPTKNRLYKNNFSKNKQNIADRTVKFQ